jgi:hypothetical protein
MSLPPERASFRDLLRGADEGREQDCPVRAEMSMRGIGVVESHHEPAVENARRTLGSERALYFSPGGATGGNLLAREDLRHRGNRSGPARLPDFRLEQATFPVWSNPQVPGRNVLQRGIAVAAAISLLLAARRQPKSKR